MVQIWSIKEDESERIPAALHTQEDEQLQINSPVFPLDTEDQVIFHFLKSSFISLTDGMFSVSVQFKLLHTEAFPLSPHPIIVS